MNSIKSILQKFGVARALPVTVLLVSARRILRADFSPSVNDLTGLWQAEAPDGEPLGLLADAALAMGPKSRRKVFLLTTLVWSGMQTLSAIKASTLTRVELEQALAFEAEALSGISPFDSTLSFVVDGTVSGERNFWITQIAASQFQAIEANCRSRGCQLAGIAHPAGIDSLGGPPREAVRNRIELWDETVFCTSVGSDGKWRREFFTAISGGEDWRSDVDDFLETDVSGEPEFLVGWNSQAPIGLPATHDLNDEAQLRGWLHRAARVVVFQPSPGTDRTISARNLSEGGNPGAGQNRVPFLEAAIPWIGPDEEVRLAVGLAVLGGLVCLAHDQWLGYRESALQKQEADYTRTINEYIALQGDLKSASQRCSAAAQRLADASQLSGEWERLTSPDGARGLPARLLATIAGAASDDAVLVSILQSWDSTQISFISLRPEMGAFSDRLIASIGGPGTRLEPPTRRGLGLDVNGGPWQLTLTLRSPAPVAPVTLAAARRSIASSAPYQAPSKQVATPPQ